MTSDCFTAAGAKLYSLLIINKLFVLSSYKHLSSDQAHIARAAGLCCVSAHLSMIRGWVGGS